VAHLVADLGTHEADTRVVDQRAGVAVVPVLVGKLPVRDLERTGLAVQVLVLRGRGGGGEGKSSQKKGPYMFAKKNLI